MHLPIPPAVLYAGLAGVLISLLVATATNKWQARVFFLLALRLAIGWHFLFEGLHKVHSYMVGPTDSNRVFTSEPYFAAAEGPLGDTLRKKFIADPEGRITARVVRQHPDMTPQAFAKLPTADQATYCPVPVATDLLNAIKDVEKTDAAKARYARWVYGVDARDAKVKFVNGDVSLTAPDRLKIIEIQQKQVDDLTARDATGLGNGYGYEQERVKAAKADLRTARSDLAADADKFVDELKKLAGADPDPAPPEKPIADLDRMTMWTITAIGACLLMGLFTRLACAGGAVFLAMTYLSHPTVPWLPLPPNTEGNPLFINKNIIEMLALLAVAAHPTGRWLGIDALIYRAFRGEKKKPKS